MSIKKDDLQNVMFSDDFCTMCIELSDRILALIVAFDIAASP